MQWVYGMRFVLMRALINFFQTDAIPLMKDYMDRAIFKKQKGGRDFRSASVILNGNINQPVETVLQRLIFSVRFLTK